MKVFTCVDNAGGMSFNNRRQSRDAKVYESIVSIVSGRGEEPVLRIAPYSIPLFQEMSGLRLLVADDFLAQAGPGDYCFVETPALKKFEDKIDTVFVFRWNRDYPADTVFPLDLTGSDWSLTGAREFEGKSHKKITLEKYERRK